MEDFFDRLQAVLGNNFSKYSNSEVITPLNIVKDMVDLLPADIFKPEAKFLDPAVKSGRFLAEIYRRLFNSPLLSHMDEQFRRRHILENQLYGLATSGTAATIVRKQLYDDPTIAGNIVYIDRYLTLMADKGTDFHKLIEKEFGQMKFDVVIGNPPYNDDESRGTIGSGNAIYPAFMQQAREIASKYISLVVPAGWMLQYPMGVKHNVIDSLRKDNRIIQLHDFRDSKDVFENVSIPNGICYYLEDKLDTSGVCDFYVHSKNKIEILQGVKLYNESSGVIFRDKYIIKIADRITAVEENYKTFSQVCAGAKHHFDDGASVMTSVWSDYSSVKTKENSIQYFVKANNKVHKYSCTEIETSGMPNVGYGWVSKDQIPKNADDYCKHKLIVGQAFTAGSPQVIDIPEYIGNNSVCSQSYIPIFSPNNTKDECLNIVQYMKTQFFRYLVNCMKTGQNLGNQVYSLVPIQDFTSNSDIDWFQSVADIDKQLYKKYGLSPEEIEYIENTIKPME